MDTWASITWVVARAGGITAYLLLTLAVVVGLALSLRWQSGRWPRLINAELHNHLTLISTIFLAVHIVAVAIDPFTHFGLEEILLPFVSSYRPLWMGLGIVGLYLGIAIAISTLLRSRIGYKVWRQIHVLTLGVFALATVHGIFVGSDSQQWWAVGMYGVSVSLVGILFAMRLMHSANEAQVRQARQREIQARGTIPGKAS